MTNKYIDLHMHTFYSDGTDSPETLVRAARLRGTEVMTISDHDTMKGYELGLKEANKWGITLIPGVEVSTELYHILGLGVNPYDLGFKEFLDRVQNIQKQTSGKRIEALANSGIPITLEKLEKYFPESRLGKYNVFMTMLLDPECRNFLEREYPGASPNELFRKHLKNKGMSTKINIDGEITAKEAIEQIHSAGGIAVIAHPFKQVRDIEKELGELRSYLIDGLEIQPNYGNKNIPFREYAEKHGMKMTYGSDYHGPAFDRPLLGRERGVAVDLEELLKGTWFMNQNKKAIEVLV
jgi:predicted metal-dependent phosphoesterase TrpH